MKKMLLLVLFAILAFNINAQTWNLQTSGTSDNLRHIFFVNSNTGWAVGEGGTILKTTNGGAEWKTQRVINNVFLIGCFFLNETTGWVSGDNGVYKTVDGGDSWTLQGGPVGVTKIFFTDKDNGWSVGGIDGSTPYVGDIFKTTDGGSTWAHTSNNTTWARFYGVQFVDVNTGWAYAEVNNVLIKTTDAGSNWQLQNTNVNSFNIQGMYFIDKNTGFIGGNDGAAGYMLKTTDGGATWVNKTPGLQYGPGFIKFFDSQNGVAAGSGRGGAFAMLFTTDGGETWDVQPTTLPSNSGGLNCGFFTDKNTGWAVGDNGVIMKYSSTTDVKNNSKNNAPLSYKLQQNYPNPFNPSTIINYSIKKSSFVTIKIYNTLGKEIVSLVNEVKSAGSYSINFNAGKLVSGIYFCKMQAGDFSETRKLVLMK